VKIFGQLSHWHFNTFISYGHYLLNRELVWIYWAHSYHCISYVHKHMPFWVGPTWAMTNGIVLLVLSFVSSHLLLFLSFLPVTLRAVRRFLDWISAADLFIKFIQENDRWDFINLHEVHFCHFLLILLCSHCSYCWLANDRIRQVLAAPMERHSVLGSIRYFLDPCLIHSSRSFFWRYLRCCLRRIEFAPELGGAAPSILWAMRKLHGRAMKGIHISRFVLCLLWGLANSWTRVSLFT